MLPHFNISVLKAQIVLMKMIQMTAKPRVSYPVILQGKFYAKKIAVLTMH